MSLNASSVASGQQWRNDLLLKSVDPIPTNQDVLKDPLTMFTNQQLMANTVCCSQTNCDKIKLETLPERFFRREPAQGSTQVATNPDGRDAPRDALNGKKETPVAPEPYMPPFCPCAVNRGHLVTICCVRRDCDEATKIPGTRDRSRSYSHFKY